MRITIYPPQRREDVCALLREHGYLLLPDLEGGAVIMAQEVAEQHRTLGSLIAEAQERAEEELRAAACMATAWCLPDAPPAGAPAPSQGSTGLVHCFRRLRRLNRRSRPQPEEVA